MSGHYPLTVSQVLGQTRRRLPHRTGLPDWVLLYAGLSHRIASFPGPVVTSSGGLSDLAGGWGRR